MTRSVIEQLLARCEAAKGPDEHINLDLAHSFGCEVHYAMGRCPVAQPYTSSLDAIVGLIERDFPTSGWAVYRTGTPHHGDRYYGRILALRTPKMKRKPTPALALCISYLRAKLALTQESGE